MGRCCCLRGRIRLKSGFFQSRSSGASLSLPAADEDFYEWPAWKGVSLSAKEAGSFRWRRQRAQLDRAEETQPVTRDAAIDGVAQPARNNTRNTG